MFRSGSLDCNMTKGILPGIVEQSIEQVELESRWQSLEQLRQEGAIQVFKSVAATDEEHEQNWLKALGVGDKDTLLVAEPGIDHEKH